MQFENQVRKDRRRPERNKKRPAYRLFDREYEVACRVNVKNVSFSPLRTNSHRVKSVFIVIIFLSGYWASDRSDDFCHVFIYFLCLHSGSVMQLFDSSRCLFPFLFFL